MTVVFTNGTFRPNILRLDNMDLSTVRWINTDEQMFVLRDLNGAFEATLAPGKSFDFDYSTLEPAIHRYKAILVGDSPSGGITIPGLIHTRW